MDNQEPGILNGMKAICDFTKKSEGTILALIRRHGFPARKIGGQWTSSAALINAWTVALLKKAKDPSGEETVSGDA